ALKQSLEMAKANTALASRRAAEARPKVVAIGGRAPAITPVESAPAEAEAAQIAPPRFSFADTLSRALPSVSAEPLRGSALGLAAVLPALAFPFAANHALIVACGLCIAAGMMLLAFDPLWRAAAWAGVVTGGVWAVVGFALHVAQAQPLTY